MARRNQETGRQREAQGIFGVPREIMLPRIALIAAVFALCVIGLVMVYSASSIVAMSNPNIADPAHYLKRQAIFLVLALIAGVIAAYIPNNFWLTPVTWIFWIITTVLLIYTLVKGAALGGAQRWISIAGLTVQPSEFAKITILLLFSATLSHINDGKLTLRQGLVILGVVVLIPFVIITNEDLGTAMIIAVSIFVLFIFAGMPRHVLFWILLALIVVGVAAIVIEPYRLRRVVAVFDPWSDPSDKGYQSIQAFYAFGSGGLLGVGIGNSTQKFHYLPVSFSDFILAIIGEETGLIGTLVVVLLFAVIIFAGFKIAQNAPDAMSKLTAVGATSLLGIQTLLNMLSVVGLFPITGKPLPFVSYGGSSIIASMILVGLIVSVSRGSVRQPEHEARRDELAIFTGGRSGRQDVQSLRSRPPRSSRSRIHSGQTGGSVRGSSARQRTQRTGRSGSNKRSSSRSSRTSRSGRRTSSRADSRRRR